MMDDQSASAYLASSESAFIRHGHQWLMHWEDPTDVLFALAGDTGQSLGPFDTFRICAILGLGPASAVRDLGHEILNEPPDQSHRPQQTIAHALALAHAHDLWPKENAPYAPDVARQLSLCANASEKAQIIASMTLLALIGKDGLCPEPNAYGSLLKTCFDKIPRLDKTDSGAVLLEISFLNRSTGNLREPAQKLLGEAQNQDGSFLGPSNQLFDKELATLRNLALFKRCHYPTRQP